MDSLTSSIIGMLPQSGPQRRLDGHRGEQAAFAGDAEAKITILGQLEASISKLGDLLQRFRRAPVLKTRLPITLAT